jgi:glycogen operon protein
LAGARRFGLAAHLYSLRRQADQGIGDFTTLARLGSATARAGGSVVAINPLHALFAEERERASPYHPSDRRFLDPIYIDVDDVPDLAAAAEAHAIRDRDRDLIATLSEAAHVDYAAVWLTKRKVLRACFERFGQRATTDPLVAEFDVYVAAGGAPLRHFALFETIAAAHPREPWHRWPAELRRPDAPGVEAFAREHADRIRFALYLQWLADRQLGAAAHGAHASGLAIDSCATRSPPRRCGVLGEGRENRARCFGWRAVRLVLASGPGVVPAAAHLGGRWDIGGFGPRARGREHAARGRLAH